MQINKPRILTEIQSVVVWLHRANFCSTWKAVLISLIDVRVGKEQIYICKWVMLQGMVSTGSLNETLGDQPTIPSEIGIWQLN